MTCQPQQLRRSFLMFATSHPGLLWRSESLPNISISLLSLPLMSGAELPSRRPQFLIRSLVRQLHPYVPGEQPKIKGLIKLNTNENPHPPSPKVLSATKAAVDGRLRLYPNPTAQPLRERLAEFHRRKSPNIIVGNGSDELLAMATRAFVEPRRATIQYFTPSYSLYPVLAEIHGAKKSPVPLHA